MPRDGSGVFSLPAGTLATANTTIESAKYNAFANDMVSQANEARPVSAGGTGATTAAQARTNLGVPASSAVQPVNANLTSLSGLTFAANKGLYTTGANTAALFDLTAAGRALLDDADAAAQRTTLGLVTPAALPSDDCDLATLGVWSQFTNISLNKPPPSTSAGILYTFAVTGAIYQLALKGGEGVSSAVRQVWMRVRRSGVWDTWERIGTPPALISAFSSTGQTITSGGALTIAHGLGDTPKLVQCYLRCTTSDLGYSVNDEVMINPGPSAFGSTVSAGVSVAYNTTNLVIRFGSNAGAIALIRKDTGAVAVITNSSWQFFVRAWA